MKQLFTFFLMIWVITQSITAQNKWDFGAKAGINFADLFGDTYSGSTFKPGIALGIFSEMQFSNSWSFAGELYYSAEGAKAYNKEPSNGSYTYSITQRINYLNLPVLAKYHINQKWNIQTGLQFGFLLCAKEVRKVKSGTADDSFQDGKKSVYDRFRPVYFSLFIGGEYVINTKMAVQGRFYSSFLDKIRNDAGDSEGTYPLIFQFTFSYKIYHL